MNLNNQTFKQKQRYDLKSVKGVGLEPTMTIKVVSLED